MASRCPTCGAATPVDLAETEIFTPPANEAETQFIEAETQILEPETQVMDSRSKPATVSGAAAAAGGTLTVGSILGGRYEILKTLGEGGMGAVFKAHDAEVDRTVALKVIRQELADSDDILRRFRQELVLARQITHRNVVRIYDLGVADGIRFISMEYIDGQELADILKQRGKLPPQEAGQIILQVCYGLAVAHAEGVVHRDLKPQNVMIAKDGRAAVMDFGIASAVEAVTSLGPEGADDLAGAAHLTRVGALLGTPRYMSPEQARAERVTNRSDLFTVGLILYELVMGDLPPSPPTLKAMLKERASKQIAPPMEANPQIPRALNDIIVRCLELDPEKRYPQAEALSHDLEIWLGIRKPHTTNWKVFGALAAAIVLAAGTMIYSLRSRPPATHNPVKILISDFVNQSGNPVLDGTLEPLLTTDLEGASFITAYNRGQARKTVASLSGKTTLDENSARLVAQREGVGVVVSGSIRRDGDKYALAARVIDARTDKVLDEETASASTPNDLNRALGRIASGFRKALGDVTPRSQQIAAAETFSSQSLEASQQYALAQELQWQGKWDDAIKAYTRSTQLDPGLGRAYAGMATVLANMGRKQEAEKDFKLAMSKIDRMSDREKYRTRGGYYLMERDYDKAIEQFQALEKQFPADPAGIGNLALADFYARNMSGAVEEGRRVLAIYPDNGLYLNNVGLYAMYAGDFDTAINESQRLLKLNPSFEKAYICLGISQLAKGDEAAAAETYRKLEPLSPFGASASAVGLADLALYQGRPDEALPLLEKGASADVAAHDASRAAAKWLIEARAWVLKGQNAKAISAAERASEASTDESLLYPAAMIFLEAGKPEKALELSQKLSQRLEPDPGAYGKLITAESQMQHKEYRDAVKTFQEAQKIADTWLGHFGLGRAYLEAGAYTEADTEFDACVKRKGEATAVFLDDEPSWRYFAPVDYYLGRAREGLGSPAAADAYRAYLKIREKSTSDPLVKDARKRLASLEAAAH